MKYKLVKKCKNSIRYSLDDKKTGPSTIYLPNEMFTNPADPPFTIEASFQV